jgi:hypothetical protein
MKARALIEESPFRAETVQAMGEAFDQLWAQIARIFGNEPHQVEAARLGLAEAMVSVATEGDTDVEDLKDRAIVVMAKHYSSQVRRQ